MKIYLLAGETSGDIHGAELIRSLKKLQPDCHIRAMGGSFMKEAGAKIAFDYKDISIMGFIEVLKRINTIRKNLNRVTQDIIEFNPDKVIMIDFPGFNLNIAKRLYKSFQLHYYIAPKAWAWNAKRAVKLAKYFHQVYCILPFELNFFKEYKVPATYVGNPSKNQVDRFLKEEIHSSSSSPYVALFPGSRKQEVERILPIMLDAIRQFPHINYKISQAPALDISVYQPFLHKEEDLIQENYELLKHAKAALVTSGTATLETALFGIPQIVCYIGSTISIRIAKLLVKVKYISLVNLILDRMAIPELIQETCTVENIHQQLEGILNHHSIKDKVQSDYEELRERLGSLNAADEVAKFVLN